MSIKNNKLRLLIAFLLLAINILFAQEINCKCDTIKSNSELGNLKTKDSVDMQCLVFSQIKLGEFPKVVFRFPNLQRIEFLSIQVAEMPIDSLNENQKIRLKRDLYYTLIKQRLFDLEDYHFFTFTSIPKDILKLNKLSYLDLFYTEIKRNNSIIIKLRKKRPKITLNLPMSKKDYLLTENEKDAKKIDSLLLNVPLILFKPKDPHSKSMISIPRDSIKKIDAILYGIKK